MEHLDTPPAQEAGTAGPASLPLPVGTVIFFINDEVRTPFRKIHLGEVLKNSTIWIDMLDFHPDALRIGAGVVKVEVTSIRWNGDRCLSFSAKTMDQSITWPNPDPDKFHLPIYRANDERVLALTEEFQDCTKAPCT